MAQIEWSRKAIQHLDGIGQYIAVNSEFQAKRVVQKIVDTAERLKKFPEIGAVVPELGDVTLREIFVFKYRVLYRLREKNTLIQIVGVIHGARLLADDLIDHE
jgi:plasmid stabilization system protein ParE